MKIRTTQLIPSVHLIVLEVILVFCFFFVGTLVKDRSALGTPFFSLPHPFPRKVLVAGCVAKMPVVLILELMHFSSIR